jgi:hypothetical protein
MADAEVLARIQQVLMVQTMLQWHQLIHRDAAKN